MNRIFEIIEIGSIAPSCTTGINSGLKYNPSTPSPFWSPTEVPSEDKYFNVDSPILVSQGIRWSDELS